MFAQVSSLRYAHVVTFNTGDGSVNGSQRRLHTMVQTSRNARGPLNTGQRILRLFSPIAASQSLILTHCSQSVTHSHSVQPVSQSFSLSAVSQFRINSAQSVQLNQRVASSTQHHRRDGLPLSLGHVSMGNGQRAVCGWCVCVCVCVCVDLFRASWESPAHHGSKCVRMWLMRHEG